VTQPAAPGQKAKVHFYHPKGDSLDVYKQKVGYLCKAARPAGWPMDGAYEVDLLFVMPRYDPGEVGRRWHTRKPDLDNLKKAIYSALEGVLWSGEGQIVDARVMKVQAAGDEQPHAVIVVRSKGNLLPGLDHMI
jgi:Holliday junction resolvase RusA-like endonuclease